LPINKTRWCWTTKCLDREAQALDAGIPSLVTSSAELSMRRQSTQPEQAIQKMQTYRINWDSLPWTTPMPGVRFKAHEQDGRKLRLAEFTHEFKEPDWCRKGHIGYVLEGESELQLGEQTIRVKPGDGIFIPPGEAHKHMLRVLSERIRMVLVEDLSAPGDPGLND
jgi:mannose-6-phosphate isomerase-like protein (cupin superfamily)